jgi:hypothetical protein
MKIKDYKNCLTTLIDDMCVQEYILQIHKKKKNTFSKHEYGCSFAKTSNSNTPISSMSLLCFASYFSEPVIMLSWLEHHQQSW